MWGQAGFFDIHERLKEISVNGDDLERLTAIGNDRVEELQIDFSSGLSASGGTINSIFSFENERLDQNRFPSGSVVGSAVAVPGPIAGAGLVPLAGLAGAWLMRRRR